MNWKHIEALLLAANPLFRDEFEGQVIISNGHIAVAFNGEFALPGDAKQQAVAKPWKTALPVASAPQPIGLVYSREEGRWTRAIGPKFVDERFFRLFPDCTWTLGAGSADPFVIHQEGALVALVMPLRVSETLQPCFVPTDEELFAPIASDKNNWYLVNKAEIQKRIGTLEEELEEKQEKIDQLEDEATEIRNAIDSLRTRKSGIAA